MGIIGNIDYCPTMTKSLNLFQSVSQNTQCAFAKQARVWSAPDWDDKLGFEENILRSVPTLVRFTIVARFEHLDGFAFCIPDPDGEFGGSPEKLGKTMKRMLSTLSKRDPSGEDSMSREIDRPAWQFKFNHERIFITSFAKCYPDSSPRYSFGATSVFILFQPEFSFGLFFLALNVLFNHFFDRLSCDSSE